MREIFEGMAIVIGGVLILCGLALLFMHPWLMLTFLGCVVLATGILLGLRWIKGWFVDLDVGAKERRKKSTWEMSKRKLYGLRADDEDL